MNPITGPMTSQDPAQENLQELGFPTPDPGQPDGLPPGGGANLLPHFQTFTALVNQVTRTYRYTYDEARRSSDTNSLAIRRDPIIMDALRTRQMPTAQLAWHLEPQNPEDQAELQAADLNTQVLEATPRFQTLKMHLLEALFFGRYGVQTTFRWDYSHGDRRLGVADHRPLHGEKLVFKWSGQVGILVNSLYPGEWSVTDRGRAHFLTPMEREQLIIHRHEPEDSDYFDGDMAGAVHGVGIRGRIYWFWWLKNQVLTWLLDYLERIGAGGVNIWFYEAGNPDSRNEVTSAAQSQILNNNILFPRYKDGSTGGPGFEHVDPNNAGAQLLGQLIQDYFDNAIRRYILGQSVSMDSKGMSIGGGGADLDFATFGRITKYDAVNLQETLTTDLVSVLYRYNSPGIPPARFVFDVDRPNSKEVLEAAQIFWQMGGQISGDELRQVAGLSKPGPGDEVLAQMGPVQPAGIGATPEGVPSMGPAGPEGTQGDVPTDQRQPESGGQGDIPQLYRRPPAGRIQYAAKLDPHPDLVALAQRYLQQAGLPPDLDVEYRPIDQNRASQMAQAYEDLFHNPSHPDVQQAYKAFQGETKAQWDHLEKSGFRMEPWTDEGQPYQSSQDMRNDVLQNRHLWFYTGGDLPSDHPNAKKAGIRVNGVDLTHNDIFRAVHDLLGHAIYGNQFGPRGEEHAYQVHSRMYTPVARQAMATETRGQNSWVNFGPHGVQNRADPANTIYAPQKAGIHPLFTQEPQPQAQKLQRTGPRVKKDLKSSLGKMEPPEVVQSITPSDPYLRLMKVMGDASPEKKQEHLNHLFKAAGVDPQWYRGRKGASIGGTFAKTEQVGKLLEHIGANGLDRPEFLKHLPPDLQNDLAHAKAITNGQTELGYWMAQPGDRGANWYDDEVTYFERGLAHLMNHHPEWSRSQYGKFGHLDSKGHLVADKEQQANQTLFKALLGGTSQQADPVSNLDNALKIFKHATATNPDNPWATLSPRQPNGKQWMGAEPNGIAALTKLIGERGVQGAAKWLLSKKNPEAIRKYNHKWDAQWGEDYPDYTGMYLMGPKMGPFGMNLSGDSSHLTPDRWWARTWNRMYNTLFTKPSGGKPGKLVDSPRGWKERRKMKEVAQEAAKEAGLSVAGLQAVYWKYEQSLWKLLGADVSHFTFRHGIDKHLHEGDLYNGFQASQAADVPGSGKPVPKPRSRRPSPLLR